MNGQQRYLRTAGTAPTLQSGASSMRLRPACLARYMARSARRTSSSGAWSRWGTRLATPKLTVTMPKGAPSCGKASAWMACWIWRATSMAACASDAGSSTTNSSPPKRAARSPSRRPPGAGPFVRQGLVKMGAVGKAGEPIGVADQLQPLVGLRQGLGALFHQRLQLQVALLQAAYRVHLAVTRQAVGDGNAAVGNLPVALLMAKHQHQPRGLAGKQCVRNG